MSLVLFVLGYSDIVLGPVVNPLPFDSFSFRTQGNLELENGTVHFNTTSLVGRITLSDGRYRLLSQGRFVVAVKSFDGQCL